MDIVALFCDLDDFCQRFEPWMQRQLLSNRQRRRQATMHLSEVMTIVVLFHLQGFISKVIVPSSSSTWNTSACICGKSFPIW